MDTTNQFNDPALASQTEQQNNNEPMQNQQAELNNTIDEKQERTEKLKAIIIDALEDIKAKEITVINTAHKTKLFDAIVICSATSYTQTRSLAHHVATTVKAQGFSVQKTEGLEAAEWVLVDCIDIIVHIMLPPIRAYYNLEGLWNK